MGGSGGALDVRVGEDLAEQAAELAAHLADEHRDVLVRDVVVVPTPGIGRWLASFLARRLGATGHEDGVFANADLLLFGDLVARVLQSVDAGAASWSLDAMALRALALLADPSAPEELRRLVGEAPGTLRLPVARACADLFDQLFRWRPDVADAWLAGSDHDPRAALLRALADATPSAPPHRLLDEATERLRDGEVPLRLPGCVHLFGSDGLAGGPSTPALLDALATSIDVVVHLVTPSPARFAGLLATTPRFTGPPPARRSEPEPGVDLLVRSWGTASADAARLLAQLPSRATTRVEVATTPAAAPASHLQALQSLLREGRPTPLPSDGTVELHACVGPLRQVEAARDAILAALRDDPSLRPSDVAVLCADLPRFAPHLEAVLGEPGGAPSLPYVLRDRSLSRAVPLLAAVGDVLGLLAGRCTRSAVLDLLATPAVRRRFGLDLSDLDAIVAWIDEAGVNWGLDAAERGEAGLPVEFEPGTWRRALDRALAGVALPPTADTGVLELRPVRVGHELEPLDVLCDVLARLDELRGRSAAPRPLASWCEFARAAATELLATEPTATREWQRLDELLDGVVTDAGGLEIAVGFGEFRALFADRAAKERDLVVSGPGGVTVTSFAPLRNVPFRLVVLLGLDDVSLSRGAATDGAFGAPRVGDRDPRAELRGALLSAVLAAQDRLVVTFDGADVVTNAPVAPTTALAELWDAAARACTDQPAELVRWHPRHAHGRSDLEPGRRGPFSFDHGALQRARELAAAPRRVAARVRVEPAAAPPPDRTRPGELAEFLRAPQRTFLGASLRVRVPRDAPAPSDDVPVALDDLARWQLVGDLVQLGLDRGARHLDDAAWRGFCDEFAATPDGAMSALPGRLGVDALHGRDGVAARARQLLAAVESKQGSGAPEELPVEVVVAGDTIAGTVRVFRESSIVRWTASVSDDKVRLDAAVDLLCLTAAHPGREWRAWPVCRVRQQRREQRAITLDPLVVPGETPEERQATARSLLGVLLKIRRRGLCEPLPLFFRATMKMRSRLAAEPEATRAALVGVGATSWDEEFGASDRTDAAVRYCFDGSFHDLLALPVAAGDPDLDHRADGSRLLAYSLALCHALRALERPKDEVPA